MHVVPEREDGNRSLDNLLWQVIDGYGLNVSCLGDICDSQESRGTAAPFNMWH